jgi:hypothetical protein
MSSVSEQCSTLKNLALQLNNANLKRAIPGIRPSEAAHIIQILHDSAATLASIKENPKKKDDHQW